jgi:hypothetical protein
MNKHEILKYGCAAAVSLAPVPALAATGQDGLEACVDALVVELADAHVASLVARLDPESPETNRRLGRREIFHLDARDPGSREIVARADCIVNARAEVRSLTQVPLDAGDAWERASEL